MTTLPLRDVLAIARMLGEVARVTDPPELRKRRLLEQLTRLVGGDAWVWAQGRQAPDGPHVCFSLLHGCRASDVHHAPAAELFAVLRRDVLRPPSADGLDRVPLMTRPRRPLVTTRAAGARRDGAGGCNGRVRLDDYLASVCDLGGGAYSAIGMWRFHRRRPFAQRERCITHVVASQIDPLHHAGTDVPAVAAHAQPPPLSPRQREVLLLLLGGDSRKQIARKLNLSEYTVIDYVKALHHHFGVSSHGELAALFISGDAVRAAIDLPLS